MAKTNRTLYLFCLLIALAVLLPFWLSEGMCLDGVVYSCISRNMAEGLGSFWYPNLNPVNEIQFHSHPPLLFGIGSVLYKVLGTSIYTEKIYCMAMAIVTAYLIQLNQKTLESPYRAPVPCYVSIMLWLSLPVIAWGCRHFLLENTFTVFVLASTYYILKAFKAKSLLFILISVCFRIAATMTKGYVGLFPIGCPILYSLCVDRSRLLFAIAVTIGMVLLLTSSYGLLFYCVPEAASYFDSYMSKQVISSIAGHNEVTTEHRWRLLVQLVSELAVPISVCVLVYLLNKASFQKITKVQLQHATYWLLVGLAGSLPLMISPKQHRFYLIPSLPYYIIALTTLSGPLINTAMRNIVNKYGNSLKLINVLLFLLIVISSIYSLKHPIRDKNLLEDVKLFPNRALPMACPIKKPPTLLTTVPTSSKVRPLRNLL